MTRLQRRLQLVVTKLLHGLARDVLTGIYMGWDLGDHLK